MLGTRAFTAKGKNTKKRRLVEGVGGMPGGGARRHGLPRMRVSSLCQLSSIPMEIAQEKNTYRRLHKGSCDRSVAYAAYLAMRSPGFVRRSRDRDALPPARLRKPLVEHTYEYSP